MPAACNTRLARSRSETRKLTQSSASDCNSVRAISRTRVPFSRIPKRSAVCSSSPKIWEESRMVHPSSAASFRNSVHLGNALRVETVHRLIEQQNLRLPEHRIRNAETLSHTERKGAELGFYARKSDELQYSPDFCPIPYALDPAVKAQILLCAQIRKKITADKEAYLLPSLTKPCLCRLSVNRDASALYFRESQNGFKRVVFPAPFLPIRP